MNFDNDESLNIPLFDNILSQNTVLMTPKKSPSKSSFSTKPLGEQCKTPTLSSFNTPQKQKPTSRFNTPRTMLKSFASQNNSIQGESITPASSPEKTLSMYNQLMNEAEDDLPKPVNTPAAKQHSPMKSSPLKSVDSFWQQRQRVLSRTPKKKNSPKKKTFQSMMAAIAKKSPAKPNNSVVVTPQKQQVEKRKLTLDDDDDDDAFTRVPSFNLLNPNINFNQKAGINEDRSPSKKHKSPQKNILSVKQKLIFEDDDYETTTDDGNFNCEGSLSLSEQETVFENSACTSLASSMGPYQRPFIKDTDKYISEEEIDNILFKHHLAMKTEFSVGLGEHKFDKNHDVPYLNGRQEEFNEIVNFLEDKLLSKQHSKDALMIVGPPGTGKSRQVWQIMESHYSTNTKTFTCKNNSTTSIDNVFSTIINCMGYSDLDGIINDLKTQMGRGYTFSDTATFENFLQHTTMKIILVMDEFDKFVHTKENGLYEFINLAKKYSHFVLISITNSFDIGNISEEFNLQQLIFKPYESKAIESIVSTKVDAIKANLVSLLKAELKDIDLKFLDNYSLFQRNALLTLSKKFGNQNGDLRDVTNFIYQLLERRESRALMEGNALAELENHIEQLNLVKKTKYSVTKEKQDIIDIILKHWTMKEIVFKDVNEVFNLSSDLFNLQKLLNTMSIWQQFVLVLMCKVYDNDLLEHQKTKKKNGDKYDYRGIDINDVYDKHKQCIIELKRKMKLNNNANQLRNGMNSIGSHNVLLEKEINHGDFIKIIEFLEVTGLLNKYTVRKARAIKNFVVVSHNTQDVYELLSHSALFKDII